MAVNVILPIALLNSALVLTIFALIKKKRKTMFALLALVGGGYMFLDITNGWLSTNFVHNVVKEKSWISAFAYINSIAVGLSAWFLVAPQWEMAKLLSATEKQKRITLMVSSILIVAVATLAIPILYNTIQNPFSQNVSLNNSNNNHISPQQKLVISNNSTSNQGVNSEKIYSTLHPTNISANGSISPSGNLTYYASNVDDDNLSTWWTPSPKTDGTNSWLKLDFSEIKNIGAIEIHNGSHYENYPGYGDLYLKNNRLLKANLEFSNGEKIQINLDEIDQIQRRTFSPISTNYVILRPLEWANGSQWQDLSISYFKAMETTK